MKILLVGDVHFRSKKLKDISEAWAKILEAANKGGIDLILQAGDIFDEANIHTKEADVGTVYHALIDPLKASGIPFVCVPGNHDIGQAKDKDALATIDKFDWVRVIRRPSVFELDSLGEKFKGFAVCAVPWLYKDHFITKMKLAGHDQSTTQAKIDDVFQNMMSNLAVEVAEHKAKGNFVIFLGHLEVTGAKMDNGQPQSGGSFEFSPLELAKVGADVYGFAHIHVRQSIPGLPNPNDGYIGNLCQLSFGEEKSIPGVRIIEVVDGKLKNDRIIDNTFSPRHYTVEDLSKITYRKGVDYVKLRGEVKPETLPEGIIFEKKIEITGRDITQGYMNCDTPIEDLIKKWKEAAKCPVDLAELTAATSTLLAQAKMPMASIGSLDKINFIELKNVASHDNTLIDFQNFNGILGIEGPNGAGKTTTLESILVGLFGESPSRPYLPSLVTQGCTDASTVEIGFRSGGKDYKVKREFKLKEKSFSHVANLWEVGAGEKGTDLHLAGPKVGAVDIQCRLLVGDPKLVLAGIFSSQGEAGNILDLGRVERKELFAKLLGTDKFLILSELAKKTVGATNAEIEAVIAKALRLENEALDEATELDKLNMAKSHIAALELKLTSKNESADLFKKEIQEIAAWNSKIAADITRNEQVREKRNKIISQGKLAKAKLLEVRAMIGLDLKEQVETIKSAKVEIDELRKQAQAIINDKNKLVNQAVAHRDAASKLMSDVSEKYSKYLSEINAKNDKKREEYNVDDKRRSDAVLAKKHEIELLTRRLEEAKKKAKLIEGFPNQDVCKRCPLAEDGINGRESILGLEAELVTNKEALAARELMHATHGLCKVEYVQSLEEYCKDVYPQISAEKEKAAEIEAEAAKKIVSDDIKKRGLELKNILAKEAEINAKVAAAENASNEAAQIEGQLKELTTQVGEIDRELAAMTVPDKRDDSDKKILLEGVTTEIASLKSMLQSHLIDQGRIETSLDMHKKRKEEAATIRAGIADKEKSAEVLNSLATAFSRDGIPQMIVDSTIPHFQDLMAHQMMDFDGRWSIKVASQKLTKTGTTTEVIDIIVDDGSGEREISTYSGGERKLLRSIIRIAFSSLMAQRSGSGIKILVLDEATDAMDEENSGNFIKTLSKLSSMFNQVFVVTHKDRTLATIQNRLAFQRLPGHYTTLVKRGNW